MDVQLQKEVKDLIADALSGHIYEHHKNRCATLFKPPTREEVANYCREKGLQVDPDAFMGHYQSNGWRVGKNPMKDWRAACQNAHRTGWCRPNQVGGKPRPRCNQCHGPADCRAQDGSPFCRKCQPKMYAMYGDNL